MRHIPRKRFGQHFLRDQLFINKILHAMHPESSQHWVEIGPGQGALTFPMLKQIGTLDAVELDRDLIHQLDSQSQSLGQLHIYTSDALKFDFSQLAKRAEQLHVFGNLPYNISTPLLFHLLSFANHISEMYFMLQKEVAERLGAKKNTPAYGRLSVMMQYHCAITCLFDVPPQSFSPPPKVVSTFLQLIPYRTVPYPCQNYSLFEKIVKQAFAQRRKTLRNTLKEFISDDQWPKLPIDSSLRAEALSVEEFVTLVNSME